MTAEGGRRAGGGSADGDREYARLLAAMDRGDVGEALRIVESGIDLNTPCDDGASPLFLAVLLGDLELLRAMLERGADPNLDAAEPAASCYAETPLLLARQARSVMDHEKYTPVVELLEEFGARTQ